MSSFDIALRLKALRKLSKLTQEEFAEHADMSYKFYQHIEAGRKKLVRIDTIERICNAYNISLHDFFAPSLPKKLNISVHKNIKTGTHNKKRA